MTRLPKSSKREGIQIPEQFSSRQEEAQWFDDHREELIDMVSRYGKVTPPREVANRLLSMRIPVADIERAKQIAEQRGIGYQSVLKQAIRVGLKTAEKRSA